jgi:hypothetical protein
MSTHAVFGVIAGIISVCGYIPYFRSILKGQTKPNRATFLIWSVVDVVLLTSYISSGARTTIWVALVYCFCQLGVLALSIKRGVGGLAALDITCLFGAVFALIMWWITSNAHVALYLGIICEILGFLPTIKKAYLDPSTESKQAWTTGTIAAIVNLFAIRHWTLVEAVYPAYNITFVALVAGLLWVRQKKQLIPDLDTPR